MAILFFVSMSVRCDVLPHHYFTEPYSAGALLGYAPPSFTIPLLHGALQYHHSATLRRVALFFFRRFLRFYLLIPFRVQKQFLCLVGFLVNGVFFQSFLAQDQSGGICHKPGQI